MSRFINYKQLKELQEAVKNGNEMAKNIIDKYMDDKPDMDSIGRLMDEYYGKAPIETLEKVQEKETIKPDNLNTIEEKAEDEGFIQDNPLAEQIPAQEPIDISADLDVELDGLIDTDELDDYSFRDFLKTKKRDGLRAKKNADYFKAFDEGGRQSYLSKKKDEFGHSFDGKRRQVERGFNDLSDSISKYGEMLTDMPDDGIDFDSSKAVQAYDKFTDDANAMDAFGRSWDNTDMDSIRLVLESLIQAYGKKNVIAMMNTIKGDAEGWKSFSNGRIDNAVSNYGKALDSLLK